MVRIPVVNIDDNMGLQKSGWEALAVIDLYHELQLSISVTVSKSI